ncbi:recombinase family protein [Amycolatopsis sp. lyj-23]|uniref:recombinase family protein n=1 Tax=Amycolatopsis sp. lyj-23 TaxID=2789283 RepID=UPI00397B7B95
MVNVIFAERISRDRGNTESIETQDAKLEARRADEAKVRDVAVVGKAIDRSVSGDVDFFDRPDLRKWLTDEAREQWDELWVTTQDRLSRNDMHFLAFVFKILEWGKTIVILDDPSLDLRTPEGRLIAHAKALGPAKELARIKDRVKDSHERRRYTEAWPGGVPTYGYTTVPKLLPVGDEGKLVSRKVRVLDEYETTVLHEMRGWLVDEENPHTIKQVCVRLDKRGELTNRDRWRKFVLGQEPRGEKWSPSSVKQVLTSLSLLGCKLHGLKPLYAPDGSLLVTADPVFKKEEWDTLQAAIKKREREPYRVFGASPLLGVPFCAKCGASATHVVMTRASGKGDTKTEKVYRYYRCTNQRQEKPCPGVSMRADEVEQLVEQTFLEQVGSVEVVKRSWVVGEDHTEELASVRAAISRLENERDTSASWDDEDEESYRDRKAKLVERRNILKVKPQRESGYVYEGSGVTYSQAWVDADQSKKRRLLVEAGVRFEITSMTEWEIKIPDDIKGRLAAAG